MTPLIAMPGPWLPEAAPQRDARDAARLPVLPNLDRALRRAKRLANTRDWRSGVLTALGAGADVVADAAVAASAVAPLADDTPVCLAAPLHIVAGLSRVHLPPHGRLRLAAPEEQAWCEAFNAEFGGADLHLHVCAAGGGWLLQAPFAQAARDPSPERLLGEPLQRAVARHEDERALRRLLAECEMWLAAHSLNRAREARGEWPVNALWFWGGARSGALPSLRMPGALLARGAPDAWVTGLAAHAGLPLQLAVNWDQARCVASGADPLLVLAPDEAGTTESYWQMIETDWIAPALRDIDAGHLGGITLQIGGGTWQFPRRGWLSAWRREPRNWWQIAGEARP